MKSKSKKVYRCENCDAVCQACFGRRDSGPGPIFDKFRSQTLKSLDSGPKLDKFKSQTQKDLAKKIEPVKMDILVESIEDSDADFDSVSDLSPGIGDK